MPRKIAGRNVVKLYIVKSPHHSMMKLDAHS